MNGHHLILGRLTDIVSGQDIPDTHDERYRQSIARLLLHQKNIRIDEIERMVALHLNVECKKAIVYIDFVVTLSSVVTMLVKYGPGSLVTRHRPALAASKMIAPYQIPVVVITNGEDADILDGTTGRAMSHGLDSIPTRQELVENFATGPKIAITKNIYEMAARIVYTFEVDGACPCDESICKKQ